MKNLLIATFVLVVTAPAAFASGAAKPLDPAQEQVVYAPNVYAPLKSLQGADINKFRIDSVVRTKVVSKIIEHKDACGWDLNLETESCRRKEVLVDVVQVRVAYERDDANSESGFTYRTTDYLEFNFAPEAFGDRALTAASVSLNVVSKVNQYPAIDYNRSRFCDNEGSFRCEDEVVYKDEPSRVPAFDVSVTLN